MSLAIGSATLTLVLRSCLSRYGAVFIGAIAAYTLCRQLLLPLRSEPRKSSWGRPLTMAVSAAVLVVDVVLSTLL